jgi:hypothetical protein
MRLGDLIEDMSSFALTPKKTTTLKKPQMLGRNVIRDLAILSQLSDSETTVKQQLNDSQANRMRKYLQTLGSFRE